MSVNVWMRAAMSLALFAAASASAFDAAAQANDNDRARNPAAVPSTQQPTPPGAAQGHDQTTSGQSGYNTGQQNATPGDASSAGQSGSSNTPNCSGTPPNAAECAEQTKSPTAR